MSYYSEYSTVTFDAPQAFQPSSDKVHYVDDYPGYKGTLSNSGDIDELNDAISKYAGHVTSITGLYKTVNWVLTIGKC